MEKNLQKDLEGKIVNSIFLLSILAGLFFLSPNITGNVVGFFYKTSNFVGIVLFILGLAGIFIYNRLRR